MINRLEILLKELINIFLPFFSGFIFFILLITILWPIMLVIWIITGDGDIIPYWYYLPVFLILRWSGYWGTEEDIRNSQNYLVQMIQNRGKV